MHLAEMLNNENTEIKELCVKDLRTARAKINKYCHDCACVVKNKFEGKYCNKCYLDGYHAAKHKCNLPSLKYSLLNSQAGEQLWSRMDKFHFVTMMQRSHYRYFWHCYCKWRNSYVISPYYTDDTTPLTSRKRMRLHGKA